MSDGSQLILPGEAQYNALLAFYYQEARLLDERRFEEWLSLVTDDFEYVLPVRMTMELGAESFGAVEGGIYHENKMTLAGRFMIAQKPAAWGEAPPARTKRFITNMQVEKAQDGSLRASANVMLTYFREAALNPDITIGERKDVIIPTNGSFILKQRSVYVDNGSLPARGLSLPL